MLLASGVVLEVRVKTLWQSNVERDGIEEYRARGRGCLAESVARLLFRFLRVFRLETVRKWGRVLGSLAYYLAGSRRRVALANLDLAYGDALSPTEKKAIAKSSFMNLVTTGLEFCYSPAIDRPIDEIMRAVNPEVFTDTYNREKGIILLVPHMGNWEISARWFAERGYQVHAVTRRQKQPWVTRLVSEIRKRNGIREIDKKNALNPVLRALRRGEIVSMLIDQYARREAVEVQFFGHPAGTVASAATLATRIGCDVMVACCFRFPDGSFGGVFSDPLETTVTGDRDKDLVENTQQYVSAMETFVRKYPHDWMWMHRRWRKLQERSFLGSL